MVQNKRNIIYYSDNVTLKLTYTGILLAITILVNFISSKFFTVPFAPFLKFDLALVVIVATATWIELKYAFLIIILLFIIGPSYGSMGYSLQGILGRLILATSQILFTIFFSLFYKLISKIKKLSKIKIIFSLFVALINTTIALTALNIFAFNPWFFKLYGMLGTKPGTYQSMVSEYNKFKPFFLNLPNYFLGALVVYFAFNIINLSLNSTIIYIIMKLNEKNLFINKNLSFI
ncbi:MPN527 family putative ECF transporter permease subunit [Mycoplasmopsis primatum]|uniref:MPN527 family putative ECF transporter permease subunit n=1 Tax=Mycoplasmopsis primatum TaxID=55604 RepID=UPI000A5285B6|nr:hypothetical protein [Mycoplasmopsis primatum]